MEIVYSEDKINPEEVVKYLSLTRQIQPVSAEIIKQKEVKLQVMQSFMHLLVLIL